MQIKIKIKTALSIVNDVEVYFKGKKLTAEQVVRVLNISKKKQYTYIDQVKDSDILSVLEKYDQSQNELF